MAALPEVRIKRRLPYLRFGVFMRQDLEAVRIDGQEFVMALLQQRHHLGNTASHADLIFGSG